MRPIGTRCLRTLTDGGWIADDQQVKIQLDGLLHLPDIEYLGITVDGQIHSPAGQAISRRVVSTEVLMLGEHRGNMLNIDTVRFVASAECWPASGMGCWRSCSSMRPRPCWWRVSCC